MIDSSSAEGLPALDTDGTGDYYIGRRKAERLAQSLQRRIKETFAGVVRVGTGPGYGRAWTRDREGTVKIVPIKDSWLIVTLADESQCPTYPGTSDRVPVSSVGGASLFFRYLAPDQPQASLVPSTGLADGEAVTLTVHGLDPNARYWIPSCALGASPENCDAVRPAAATSDASGSISARLRVWAAQYGTFGTTDCRVERCGVSVRDRLDKTRVELPFSFGEGVELPVPQVRLSTPGPFHDGDVVTVFGANFPPGVDVGDDIGQCPAGVDTAIEERCGYWNAFTPVVVDEDGTFIKEVRLFETLGIAGRDCRAQPGCVLAWVIPHGQIAASADLPFA